MLDWQLSYGFSINFEKTVAKVAPQGTRIPRVQSPVVQSIVSLTSSLRGQLVKCFTTL